MRFERLTGRKVTKHDNFVPAAAKLGTRTTVGPACVVGNNTTLGDKCSIKRSVLGGSCRCGAIPCPTSVALLPRLSPSNPHSASGTSARLSTAS